MTALKKNLDKHFKPSIISRLELRLSIKSKKLRNEFEKFLNLEIDNIVEKLTFDLEQKLPSIYHDLVNFGTHSSIFLSLTDGNKVAGFEIVLDDKNEIFILKNTPEDYRLSSAETLSRLLKKLIYKTFSDQQFAKDE